MVLLMNSDNKILTDGIELEVTSHQSYDNVVILINKQKDTTSSVYHSREFIELYNYDPYCKNVVLNREQGHRSL